MSGLKLTSAEVALEAERILNFLASTPRGITSAERSVVRQIMLQTDGQMLVQGEIFHIVSQNLGGGIYRLSLKARERQPEDQIAALGAAALLSAARLKEVEAQRDALADAVLFLLRAESYIGPVAAQNCPHCQKLSAGDEHACDCPVAVTLTALRSGGRLP